MAPEILLGLEFSLPADIFSLGVIFCEIISRTLVGGEVFKVSRLLRNFSLFKPNFHILFLNLERNP